MQSKATTNVKLHETSLHGRKHGEEMCKKHAFLVNSLTLIKKIEYKVMMMKEGSIKVNFRTQGVGVTVLGCDHLSQQ